MRSPITGLSVGLSLVVRPRRLSSRLGMGIRIPSQQPDRREPATLRHPWFPWSSSGPQKSPPVATRFAFSDCGKALPQFPEFKSIGPSDGFWEY